MAELSRPFRSSNRYPSVVSVQNAFLFRVGAQSQAIRNALFQTRSYPMRADSQGVHGNLKPIGELLPQLDLRSLLLLIILDDQAAAIARQRIQTSVKTDCG